VNVPFVNTGSVQVQSGTLVLSGGGSATGSFAVPANTTLQFGGGTYTLSSASSVTGAGNVTFSGSSTITANGTYNITGTNTISGATVNFNVGGSASMNALTLSGGTLGGTLPLTVTGPFTWSSGNIYNTGGVTLNGTSTLSGAGNVTMQLYGLLINAGTLTWGGSGNNLALTTSGILTNLATGTITLTADVSTFNGYGIGTLGNAGLFRKTAGTGPSTIDVPFVNTGSVQANTGSLSFSGNFIQNAGQTVLAGGNFAFSQVAQFRGGALSGSGTITGSVSNSATVSPGASPGLLAISGSYTEAAGAHLQIELGGTTPGTGYDQLSVAAPPSWLARWRSRIGMASRRAPATSSPRWSAPRAAAPSPPSRLRPTTSAWFIRPKLFCLKLGTLPRSPGSS